jgi:hypothetical protein
MRGERQRQRWRPQRVDASHWGMSSVDKRTDWDLRVRRVGQDLRNGRRGTMRTCDGARAVDSMFMTHERGGDRTGRQTSASCCWK